MPALARLASTVDPLPTYATNSWDATLAQRPRRVTTPPHRTRRDSLERRRIVSRVLLDKLPARSISCPVATDRKLHREQVPEPLEAFLGRLGELRVIFGDAGAATVAAVEDDLRRAVAARDRGAQQESLALISRGMERLARLADTLDPRAGMAMRQVIGQFRAALTQGREGEARRAADVMRQMSGARLVRKPD